MINHSQELGMWQSHAIAVGFRAPFAVGKPSVQGNGVHLQADDDM